MPVNKQLATVCDMIHGDPNLSDGFHLIGFSQGGLFVRALAQRCPPAKRLGSVISIGGPQQGVYGLPFCPNGTTLPLCLYLQRAISKSAYTDFIQSQYVLAIYFNRSPVRNMVNITYTDSFILRLLISPVVWIVCYYYDLENPSELTGGSVISGLLCMSKGNR